MQNIQFDHTIDTSFGVLLHVAISATTGLNYIKMLENRCIQDFKYKRSANGMIGISGQSVREA